MAKIAVLVPDLTLGGGQRSAVSTAELLSFDHEVTLVVFSSEGCVFDTSLPIISLNCLVGKGLFGKVYNVYKRQKRFKQLSKRNGYDVVVSFLESANLCAFLSNRSNSILTLHLLPIMLSQFDQSVMKFMFPYAPQVVAVSKGLKDYLSQNNFNFRQLSIINNPVDAQSIQKQAMSVAFSHPKPYVVSAGRLTYQKAYDVMIEAFQAAAISETHDLIIIGDGEERDALTKLAERYANVKILGAMKNPFPVIKAADVFLLTSRFEAFPMVLLEALALEKAVVAYNCPTGLSGLIQDQYNGLLVENNDFYGLVNALDEVGQSESKRRFLSANALLSVESFSYENIRQLWNQTINLSLERT